MQSILSSSVDVLVAGLLIGASLHDIAARTIPNWMPLSLAALGIVSRVAEGSILSAAVASLVIFLAGMFCWLRRWLGGGDVKLLAAAALAVPPGAALGLVTMTAFAGGILAVIYLTARKLVPQPADRRPQALAARVLRAECWRIHRGGPLPYACAIATGTFIILMRAGA